MNTGTINMDAVNAIVTEIWIPVIAFVVCLTYALILLITKNPKCIRKKTDMSIKDETKYAVNSGYLMLFLAIGALIMCFLIFVNNYVATAQIATWFVVYAILWKRNSDKYGSTN